MTNFAPQKRKGPETRLPTMPNAFSYSCRNIYNNDTIKEVAQYCQYKLTMIDGNNGTGPRARSLGIHFKCLADSSGWYARRLLSVNALYTRHLYWWACVTQGQLVKQTMIWLQHLIYLCLMVFLFLLNQNISCHFYYEQVFCILYCLCLHIYKDDYKF